MAEGTEGVYAVGVGGPVVLLTGVEGGEKDGAVVTGERMGDDIVVDKADSGSGSDGEGVGGELPVGDEDGVVFGGQGWQVEVVSRFRLTGFGGW